MATDLGKVAGAIFATTPPADTSFLWMQILNAAQPNLVIPHYFDTDANDWVPFSGGVSFQKPVISIINNPPGSPSNGDRHIVGTSPTGDFASNANDIATRANNAWTFFTPVAGTLISVSSQSALYTFFTSWEEASGDVSQSAFDTERRRGQALFRFTSNLFNVVELPFKGVITSITQDLSANLSAVSYEAGLDAAPVAFTAQADLTALQNWINANISGDRDTGSEFWIRCIATYTGGQTGVGRNDFRFNETLPP